MIVRTKRLILRPWQESDLEPFAQLNADPRVMEYFSSVKSYSETAEEFRRIQENFDRYGWGFWAASLVDTGQFIGFIGLHHVGFTAHFTPAVEIGWRLGVDFWGKGYATEGAKAALKYGFEILNLGEIVSLTAVQNKRSRAVMEKIGMHHDPKDDFDYPKLPEGHYLKRYVLYRMNHIEWRSS